MTVQNLFAIINLSNNSIYKIYGTIPGSLEIGKKRIISPVTVGDEGIVDGITYRFVNFVRVDFNQPGEYYTIGTLDESLSGDGLTLTFTQNWTAWDQATIDAYLATQLDEIVNEIDESRTLTRGAHMIIFKILRGDIIPGQFPTLTVDEYKNRLKQEMQ